MYQKGGRVYDRLRRFEKLDRHEKTIKSYRKIIEGKPDYASFWYNVACAYSLLGKKEESIKNLKRAIELDRSNKEEAKKEEDFKNLWEDEDFKKLVE